MKIPFWMAFRSWLTFSASGTLQVLCRIVFSTLWLTQLSNAHAMVDAADEYPAFLEKLRGAWVISEWIEDQVEDTEVVGQTVLIVDNCIFIFNEDAIVCFQHKDFRFDTSKQSLAASATIQVKNQRPEGVLAAKIHWVLGDEIKADSVPKLLEVEWKGEITDAVPAIDISLKLKKLDAEVSRKRISRILDQIHWHLRGFPPELLTKIHSWLKVSAGAANSTSRTTV